MEYFFYYISPNHSGVVPTGIRRGFGLFGQGHTVEYFHKWLPLGPDRWGNESGVDHVFVQHPCYRRYLFVHTHTHTHTEREREREREIDR